MKEKVNENTKENKKYKTTILKIYTRYEDLRNTMENIIVAKYWVSIYEPHYDHNDLFFWISSLRTQSKNYINIWN